MRLDEARTYRCRPPKQVGGQHHRPIISGIAVGPASASDKADADRVTGNSGPDDRGKLAIKSVFGSATIEVVEFIPLPFNLPLISFDLLILVGSLSFTPLQLVADQRSRA